MPQDDDEIGAGLDIDMDKIRGGAEDAEKDGGEHSPSKIKMVDESFQSRASYI